MASIGEVVDGLSTQPAGCVCALGFTSKRSSSCLVVALVLRACGMTCNVALRCASLASCSVSDGTTVEARLGHVCHLVRERQKRRRLCGRRLSDAHRTRSHACDANHSVRALASRVSPCPHHATSSTRSLSKLRRRSSIHSPRSSVERCQCLRHGSHNPARRRSLCAPEQ